MKWNLRSTSYSPERNQASAVLMTDEGRKGPQIIVMKPGDETMTPADLKAMLSDAAKAVKG